MRGLAAFEQLIAAFGLALECELGRDRMGQLARDLEQLGLMTSFELESRSRIATSRCLRCRFRPCPATWLDSRSRHKLRIQAKKVRYASEFFAGLFPGKKALKRREKFLSGLESVQDCLGDLNDIAVHEDRMTVIANEGRRKRRRRDSPNAKTPASTHFGARSGC
jgi:CHAD domain-containing protein